MAKNLISGENLFRNDVCTVDYDRHCVCGSPGPQRVKLSEDLWGDDKQIQQPDNPLQVRKGGRNDENIREIWNKSQNVREKGEGEGEGE